MRFCRWCPGRISSETYSRAWSSASAGGAEPGGPRAFGTLRPRPNDREGDKSSLLEDAECFPRPVRGGRSNLVRLQLVFEEVYSKHFRTALPG